MSVLRQDLEEFSISIQKAQQSSKSGWKFDFSNKGKLNKILTPITEKEKKAIALYKEKYGEHDYDDEDIDDDYDDDSLDMRFYSPDRDPWEPWEED
jgi:hypothetical protein